MAVTKLLKIRVSLKGRPIKSYTFKKELVTVGRSPESDIFLDNPGVSRDHLRIQLTQRGYYEVEDLGSANGSFLNDEKVDRETLMNNDVVRAGKFSLWINYEEDRRGSRDAGGGSPTAFEGTTVLSTKDLEEVMARARETDNTPPSPKAKAKAKAPAPVAADDAKTGGGKSRITLIVAVAVAFLVGTAVGAGAAMLVIG